MIKFRSTFQVCFAFNSCNKQFVPCTYFYLCFYWLEISFKTVSNEWTMHAGKSRENMTWLVWGFFYGVFVGFFLGGDCFLPKLICVNTFVSWIMIHFSLFYHIYFIACLLNINHSFILYLYNRVTCSVVMVVIGMFVTSW